MSDRYSRDDMGPLTIPGPVTPLKSAIGRFLVDLRDRNYSPHTIRIRRMHLMRFARWSYERGVENEKLVTKQMVRDHRSWLRTDSGISPGGQSRAVDSLRVFFRFLVREEEIETSPAMHMDVRRTPRALPTCILTREEVDHILAQPGLHSILGLRDRAIMETFFATGIRRMELIRLRLDDVDFERGLLRVRRGKGEKGRVVPISERALAWIARYLDIRPEGIGEDHDILFLTRDHVKLGAVTLSRNVRKYVESARVDKPGSTHMFRATTATMMLEGGADIRYVQEMLGHANLETTAIYARVTVAALQRVYSGSHPSVLDGEADRTLGMPHVVLPQHQRWQANRAAS